MRTRGKVVGAIAAGLRGVTTGGTGVATIGAGVVSAGGGRDTTASPNCDNTVSFTAPDTTPPSVTINQAATQADPTSSVPINFTVVFSEPVSGFTGDRKSVV